MSVFDAYEQELNSLNKELDRNINELKQCGADKTKANTLISIIDEKITEYGNLMKEAEMEVRGYDLATRRQLNEKIEFHRKLLKDSKLDFARAREVSERSELMGAQSALDRQRMLDVNEK